MKLLGLVILLMFVAACSDDVQKVDGEQDHVWKEQTDMIDKAKDVEQLLNNAAAQQRQLIDEQTQ